MNVRKGETKYSPITITILPEEIKDVLKTKDKFANFLNGLNSAIDTEERYIVIDNELRVVNRFDINRLMEGKL